MIFNKKASFDDWENSEKPSWLYVELTNWVYEEDMSDKEKEAFPSYVTEGGYLKVYSSLQAAWIDAWERTSEEDRELTFKLPNFDKAVFQEIFGFDPLTYCRESKNKEIVIDGKTIEISQESFEALKQQLLEG